MRKILITVIIFIFSNCNLNNNKIQNRLIDVKGRNVQNDYFSTYKIIEKNIINDENELIIYNCKKIYDKIDTISIKKNKIYFRNTLLKTIYVKKSVFNIKKYYYLSNDFKKIEANIYLNNNNKLILIKFLSSGTIIEFDTKRNKSIFEIIENE